MSGNFRSGPAGVSKQLAVMCRCAADSMRAANHALLTADLELAERVQTTTQNLAQQSENCEESARALLKRRTNGESPDAMVVAFQRACRFESMGELTARIARTARFSHPDPAIPAELADMFTDLGAAAAALADQVADLVGEQTEPGAASLAERDELVDALRQRVVSVVTDPRRNYPAHAATGLALLARDHRQFAEEALSAALLPALAPR